ncbi:unnamed protein product [Brassica rapa]|uniref:Uncharacterized protein n=2 Tax=Brassica TaxID=3705 RepID=A0A3P6DEX9_BRACM|nr:unnamed protein product [Brassica napus]CAG7911024.1 unnamed protein product [Brassica rapa]CDY38445.1 BnaA10g17130D [Brassica napus]VDD19142.1 unnamed protein product [Brassica rapa]
MSSFISKDTKTLADFDLAVGHESFEDGGQAEHTPKSRHVIGKLKRCDVSIGESTATDGDPGGERGTTFDRDELRVRAIARPKIKSNEDKALPEIESDEDKALPEIKSDNVKALPEIESDEDKALPETEPNSKIGWFDFTNTKEFKIQNGNNPKTLLEDGNIVAI